MDVVAHDGPCWWCGRSAPGLARPRSILPATFPFPLEAACPASDFICLPCGWTLCDRVRLPHHIAVERIRSKAATGRRQQVSIRGEPPTRVLTLELDDGRVGIWGCGPNVAAEKPWADARAELRSDPQAVDCCPLLDVVTYEQLDAGPVEKFRSFHHFATPTKWWPTTDSERMAIREWLLSPPPPPWVGVIGEGKKHHAIYATLLGAVTTRVESPVVYYLGQAVWYDPAALAALVEAIERLIAAGASDDEITAGSYAPRGLPLLVAIRDAEPVIRPVRGSPKLDLALYIRRNRKELSAC